MGEKGEEKGRKKEMISVDKCQVKKSVTRTEATPVRFVSGI